MLTLQTYIQAFEKLQSNIDIIIAETFSETSEFLTDDIKEQLFAGTDATGSKIQPRYISSRYANKKFLMNSKPGLFVPDLKYSGALYEGLFVIVKQQSLLFDSKVDYAYLLEKKYGVQIFEPSKTNLNDYIKEYFLPLLIKKIQELTGLVWD